MRIIKMFYSYEFTNNSDSTKRTTATMLHLGGFGERVDTFFSPRM